MTEQRRRRGARNRGRTRTERGPGDELRLEKPSPEAENAPGTEEHAAPVATESAGSKRSGAQRPRALQADRFPVYAAIATVIVAVLAYANALGNGLVLDDRWVLLDNPLVANLSGVWKSFAAPYWPEVQQAGQYRPLVIGSFATDWAIAGNDPRWFHLVNILWHAGASLLVWCLMRQMLSPAGALASALLFAVHPVHVEAVANVVGRAEPMMTVFVIGALLLHDRRNALAPLLFALALASKESGIVFLGLAAGWDILLRSDWRGALRERRWLYAGYSAVAVGYAVVLAFIFQGRTIMVPASIWLGSSTGERLLTVVSLIPHYVRLMVAPLELSADYNPRVITLATNVSLQVLTGFALLIIILVCLALAWRRSRVAFFALIWIAVALSPVSNVFFASGIGLAERTLYLPSAGFVLLAGLLFEWGARRRVTPTLWVSAVVLALMAARSWTRTPTWKDNRTLVLTTLADHPESYKVHQQAGGILLQIGDSAGSVREYGIAALLFNRDPYFYREVAEAALRKRDFHRALAMLDTSIALMPNHPSPWMRVADSRYNLGQYPQAIAAARQAYRLAQDSVRALVIIALSARAMGDNAAAAEAYRTGLVDHPDSWEIHSGYADLLLDTGDVEAARRESAIGVRLSGGTVPARAVQRRVDSALADSGSLQRTMQKAP